MNTENKSGRGTWRESFWEIVRFGILVLVIVLPVRILIAEPFIVNGSSMLPSFEDGDYLIIDKVSYRLNDPERQDVVIFRFPNDQKKFFIKRIIGLPNETIEIQGSVVTVTDPESGEKLQLQEPYVKHTADNIVHLELGSDEYFVMGDNRGASSDSRYWGAVKKDLIAGEAFLRLLPITKINILPGK